MSNSLSLTYRPRRLRRNPQLRELVQENLIHLSDLIQPIFIDESIDKAQPIEMLPGIMRLPEASLPGEIAALYELGIRYVMPFGISSHKDFQGSDTWSDNGLLARMIRTIKQNCSDMIVIPDICFCEYTTHGHCGVVVDGEVDNDLTVMNLVKQSLTAAWAGADMLAPSSMMDGQVGAIRTALDAAGFSNVAILAHAIKFSSAFYGPFRSAVDCELTGDRHGYQADIANGRQAMVEARLDEEQGADILMVKPGTPYLDVLSRLRQRTDLPLAIYQVGGEYAAIKFAALAGALDEKRTVLETMMGFKRAGADMIVSYYARQVAYWLQESTDCGGFKI
ncbi:porphobilinogen synthase [Prodigiosinella aquatilis]|nr:porphobilinogen synthase [Prodigiosinella sp. LS101]WJV53969.1 porphobilinogen synthase [Prodigiosinella sp. LS101]WJV58330.1 porphobilinogen synthase [Pectobacteriaceae bacterium C111]